MGLQWNVFHTLSCSYLINFKCLIIILVCIGMKWPQPNPFRLSSKCPTTIICLSCYYYNQPTFLFEFKSHAHHCPRLIRYITTMHIYKFTRSKPMCIVTIDVIFSFCFYLSRLSCEALNRHVSMLEQYRQMVLLWLPSRVVNLCINYFKQNKTNERHL